MLSLPTPLPFELLPPAFFLDGGAGGMNEVYLDVLRARRALEGVPALRLPASAAAIGSRTRAIMVRSRS